VVQIQTGKMPGFPLVLLGKAYWDPLIGYLRSTLLREATIDAADVDRLIVCDSPREAVDAIRERATAQFGLVYGPRIKRRWYLGER
jgi:predicted Rossmann-fold nucleotide-binding protein